MKRGMRRNATQGAGGEACLHPPREKSLTNNKNTTMKATELMIGDWVQFDGRSFKVDDVTVINPVSNPALVTRCYIRADVESPVGCFNDAIIIESALPLKDIYPIPLTDEILNKNAEGITSRNHRPYEWTWNTSVGWLNINNEHNGDYEIVFSSDGYPITAIKYVHELQHALRLCGIEKEVVL